MRRNPPGKDSQTTREELLNGMIALEADYQEQAPCSLRDSDHQAGSLEISLKRVLMTHLRGLVAQK